ncbi:MAG: phage baseplate assembly protein V [Acidobacteriota bacterium]
MELEQIVADLVRRVERRFYGKYRGFVVRNEDPRYLGRVTLRVPSVLGPDVVTGWAMPCVPYGGQKNQGSLYVPEVGAGVWVEFEEGDLEFPIWVGTFWSAPGGISEIPALNDADGRQRPNDQPQPTRRIIKTGKGHTIQFEDADGQEMIVIVEATHKHVVTLDRDGIQITDGVNGSRIVLGKGGIQVGSGAASEPFVLGNQFRANMAEFLKALNAHTHAVSGATATAMVPSLTLQVPLSARHRVE